jgi:hypothetical protein
MKGKYISALVGIGAAAMFALPGVASASTAGHARYKPGIGNCYNLHIPSYDRGKKIWVRIGHGRTGSCTLVSIHTHWWKGQAQGSTHHTHNHGQ